MNVNAEIVGKKLSEHFERRGAREYEFVTCLDKLKLGVDKIPFYSEDELNSFLNERGLDGNSEYIESKMYVRLYQTVVEVLQSLLNNIDLIEEYYTEFPSTEAAIKHIQSKIDFLKGGIDSFIASNTIPLLKALHNPLTPGNTSNRRTRQGFDSFTETVNNIIEG